MDTDQRLKILNLLLETNPQNMIQLTSKGDYWTIKVIWEKSDKINYADICKVCQDMGLEVGVKVEETYLDDEKGQVELIISSTKQIKID